MSFYNGYFYKLSIFLSFMKIAHIIQTSIDFDHGGVATYLRNIVPAQIKSGHEVKAITNKKYSQFGAYSYPMSDFNFLNYKKSEALFHSLNVNLQLALSDFDILHYHFAPSAFFSFMPAVVGKKRVLTVHGRTEVARKLGPATKAILDFVNRTVIPKMDAVTTVTPYLNKFILERYGKDNLYLPHGFSNGEIKEANIIKEKFGLTKDSYYLALGRLTQSKGFDTIIEAYKNIPDHSRKLVVAGSPEKEYFKYLKKLVPRRLEDKIVFTGIAKEDVLSELYSNAFLYISGIENMGSLSLTILEAIAHKVPVITSNILGDNHEINKHTHKFENGNARDLSEVISRLEDDSGKRLKHIDDAYACAFRNHNWENISNKFIDIYNHILR